MTPTIDGAAPEVVRRAIRTRDPFPDTAGFAGAIDDALVRDVLGRRPVYYEGSGADSWAFCPGALEDPQLLPAGTVLHAGSHRRIWTLPEPTPTRDGRAVVDRLRTVLQRHVRAMNGSDLGIAFSGGVDSALLATHLDAPCIVTSVEDGRDRRAAKETADLLGLELREVILTTQDIADWIPRVAAATGRTDPMDLSIAIPLAAAADRAGDDGLDRLVLGQGADELFAGYEKTALASGDHRVAAKTVRGARDEVLGSLPAQLARDICAVRAAGPEPVIPYLHDAIVNLALRLPEALLVDDRGTRKVALRLAGRAWLPDEVAFRPKVAVQYGSHVAREIERLARQAGYKRRMADHVQRYIASRVG